ncbi:MAG: hypothetical protein K2Y01_09570 [Rhabdochlamydiaceae bacterium]|nr:hypothetical protein [Rhabdochlamydiaceae bacterium]
MSFPIRYSSVEKEGLFRASKWLKHAVLLSVDELRSLLSVLSSFVLIPASGLLTEASWQVSEQEFLEKYASYLDWMKLHETLPPPSLRRFFSLMLSNSLDPFYAVAVPDEKIAIKASLPVIQIQLFHCFFSSFDHQIRSMVASPESFGWGIQISYPQIYEHPKTHQFAKVLLEEGFPNSKPFKEMVFWLRKNTQPVALQEDGRAYAPFRIGKLSLNARETHKGLQNMLSNGLRIQ